MIVPKVCEAIITNLVSEYIKLPTNAQKYGRRLQKTFTQCGTFLYA
nr:unnamed protein product [Callosobruchus analis]